MKHRGKSAIISATRKGSSFTAGWWARLGMFGGLLTSLVLMGMGCLSNDDDTIGGSDNQGSAPVKFINVGPTTPAIDVFLDDTLFADDVDRYASSEYISVAVDNYSLEVKNAQDTGALPLLTTNIDINRAEYFTVFLHSIGGSVGAVKIMDEFTPPDSGTDTTAVRFVNMTSDMPQISLTQPGVDSILSTSFVDIAGQSASDFARLETGTYTLELRAQDDGAVLVNLPGVVFVDGWVYTVVAVGSETGAAGSELAIEVYRNFPT
ncbi:DUF4397 domain-containing protein [candidate division GN15 bacterium]|nr:DUF4397 domain-containing protein [candidate division GN15 bacterium]